MTATGRSKTGRTAVAAARRQTGVNQRDFAERLGVSNVTLCRVERGKYTPSLRLALRIAAAVGGTVGDYWGVDAGGVFARGG